MARDDEDDLYNEEFDFVDDEDDQGADEPSSDVSDFDDEPIAARERTVAASSADDDEPVDEYGRPEPATNYVVHIYEVGKYRRTIERPFTPEDAEAFATEYNRTAKAYHRMAVAGKNDAKPKKSLD